MEVGLGKNYEEFLKNPLPIVLICEKLVEESGVNFYLLDTTFNFVEYNKVLFKSSMYQRKFNNIR
jgi:hypothetical protein